jgi:hypothetical protein
MNDTLIAALAGQHAASMPKEPVQQTQRVAIQLLERLFCDAERLEIQIIPGCVTLGRFISLFDAV